MNTIKFPINKSKLELLNNKFIISILDSQIFIKNKDLDANMNNSRKNILKNINVFKTINQGNNLFQKTSETPNNKNKLFSYFIKQDPNNNKIISIRSQTFDTQNINKKNFNYFISQKVSNSNNNPIKVNINSNNIFHSNLINDKLNQNNFSNKNSEIKKTLIPIDSQLPKITNRISLKNFHRNNIVTNTSNKFKLFNKTSGILGLHGFTFNSTLNGFKTGGSSNMNFFKENSKLKINKEKIINNENNTHYSNGLNININLNKEHQSTEPKIEKEQNPNSSRDKSNEKKRIFLNKNMFNTKASTISKKIYALDSVKMGFNPHNNQKQLINVNISGKEIKELSQNKDNSKNMKRNNGVCNINNTNNENNTKNKKVELCEDNNDSFLNEINVLLCDVKNEKQNIQNINLIENDKNDQREESDDDDKEPDPRINFEQISRLNRSRPQTSYGGLNARKKNLQSALQNNRHLGINNNRPGTCNIPE